MQLNNKQQPTDIKLILGLGNPGPKFERTRHNVGFLIVDELANIYSGEWSEKSNYLECSVIINNKSIILVKPLTFMNNSGDIFRNSKFKNINNENILVVHDELDFPEGKLGFKFGGSARGHNGIKSIIAAIGDQFWRLRFGISRPLAQEDVPDYVLSRFENQNLNQLISSAVDFLQNVLQS